ncbi:MAG: single-stranded DNA-binding protein [Bacteroidales bacterium]|jgi:single-strand DNA-binding protein|nr:single-stranded DNA-binding protein [Bacteroidales bacterium]
MSVNKVFLIGNVGKDPDVKHLDNNLSVASFPLATSERAYTMQNGTQVPERTEWHNIVAWRGLAKLAEDYIRKGSPIYLEGKIRSRSWEDQNGVRRYITEIFADTIELLGRKSDGQQAPHPGTAYPEFGAQPAQTAQPQTPQPQPQSQPDSFGNDEAPDGDLPF